MGSLRKIKSGEDWSRKCLRENLDLVKLSMFQDRQVNSLTEASKIIFDLSGDSLNLSVEMCLER